MTGALAAGEDTRIDEAMMRELRTVRKVRLEIRQEYESADDEAMKPRAGPTAGAKGFLPLLALTREIVKMAGWELAATGEEGDVTLRIDVVGTPLGENYTSISGGPTGYHYTGARLAGSIILEKAGQTVREEEFEAVEPVKELISRAYSRWDDAPFQEVLPEYCAGILDLLRHASGPALLLAGIEHKEAAIREGALRTLVAAADPSAAPAFIRLLADKSDDISRLAAWGVGALGSPAALPALLAALRTVPSAPPAVDDAGRRLWLEVAAEREPPEDRSYSVKLLMEGDEEGGDRRQAILWALMQIDAPEKKDLLRAALRDPTADELRANAALLLGRSEGKTARDVLLAALRDPGALVRAAAVVALSHVDGGEQAEPLLEATGDTDALVRELAREALDELQGKQWDEHVAASLFRPVHGARKNREFVAAALANENPLIRAEALEIALDGGLRDHLPTIREIARGDKQPFLRREALAALADQHDPQSVATAIAGLSDPVVFVRQQALTVLSGAASEWEQSAPPPLPESVVAPLMAFLANSDNAGETVDGVLGILQRVQGPAGLRAMEQLAGEPGPVVVRRQAVKFLAKTRPESTWPLLLDWAGQAEGELAYVLRECLVEAGQPGMLQPLIVLLKSERRESRRLAADVLGRLNQPRAVGPLIAALQVAESPGPGRDEVLAGGARIALHALTGQEFARVEEWRQWWKENAARLNAP